MTETILFNRKNPPQSFVERGTAPEKSGARVFLYIDGFNFYYNSLKKNHKLTWLDLMTLARKLFPRDNISGIKYFTAKVKPTENDQNIRYRQSLYFNALKQYIPQIEIIYGHFLVTRTRMRHQFPPPNTVPVIKTEEKGSDVNLAVHMLNDAWLDKYDIAALLSSDSDMVQSVKFITEMGKKVVWLKQSATRCNQLQKYATSIKEVRKGLLKKCQLPNKIPDSNIQRPQSWS